MTTKDLLAMAKDYDVDYDAVSVAAIATVLTRRGGEKRDLQTLFDNLQRILDVDELVDVVKWGTWVKHANKKDLLGKTAQELMTLQKETAYA
jgi:hypothetical protein